MYDRADIERYSVAKTLIRSIENLLIEMCDPESIVILLEEQDTNRCQPISLDTLRNFSIKRFINLRLLTFELTKIAGVAALDNAGNSHGIICVGKSFKMFLEYINGEFILSNKRNKNTARYRVSEIEHETHFLDRLKNDLYELITSS